MQFFSQDNINNEFLKLLKLHCTIFHPSKTLIALILSDPGRTG